MARQRPPIPSADHTTATDPSLGQPAANVVEDCPRIDVGPPASDAGGVSPDLGLGDADSSLGDFPFEPGYPKAVDPDDPEAMFAGLREQLEESSLAPFLEVDNGPIPTTLGTPSMAADRSPEQRIEPASLLSEGPTGIGEPARESEDSDQDQLEDTDTSAPRLHNTPPPGEAQFIYLAGDAGTGKSYQAKRRVEEYDDAVLLATTGIAAVNVGGTTINSELRYFDSASMQLEYEFGRLGAAIGQLCSNGVRRIVIDEISMMDGRQLDLLMLAIDDQMKLHPERDPIGLTLTGDFAQLPPVGVDRHKGWDGTLYAFQAKHWPKFAENTQTLTKIWRQTDPNFIQAIQQVRKGDKSCVDYFRKFITPDEVSKFDGTTILAKNDEVERYNKVRMLQLDAPIETFRSARTSLTPQDMPKEWKNIPETLELKPGCLVMILANRKESESLDERRQILYANGDLAHYIRKITEVHAEVELLRTKQKVIVVNAQRERLKPGIPRNRRASGNYKEGDILANIDYMPLRVAYASTVHKSQGLSLDNVQVMINSQFWMSSGMLYVGLSRARSPQGLRIVGTVDQFAARVRVNPMIKEWL